MFPEFNTLLSSIDTAETKQQAEEKAQAQVLADPANQAVIIREGFAPAILASIAGKNLSGLVDATGFQAYCNEYLAASGNPTDPAEIMLLQQMLWSHHRIGQLLADAAAAKSPQLAEIYSTAAARLMAEHRRSTLALRQYRAPVLAKQVTLVKNVAAGDQQIAVLQGDGADKTATKKSNDTKQGTKKDACDNADQPTPHPTSDRQPVEQIQAKGPVGERQASAA